ncbi:MAG: hypothetical protein FJ128_06860 [Deltaproteobacteria bacterium]|nr:hypothetical protein [Deltaproteobacteria bacterium]
MAISYLDLVSEILNNFRLVKNPSDIVKFFGEGCITEISDEPLVQVMDKMLEILSPLPIGFEQKTFQFIDINNNQCVFDVTFYENKLVNFRCQKYFKGWFALGKAIKFNSFKLRPLVNKIIGIDSVHHDFANDKFYCDNFKGLVVVFGQINENKSVSTWITDKQYF